MSPPGIPQRLGAAARRGDPVGPGRQSQGEERFAGIVSVRRRRAAQATMSANLHDSRTPLLLTPCRQDSGSLKPRGMRARQFLKQRRRFAGCTSHTST
jgi:hypothetical protein